MKRFFAIAFWAVVFCCGGATAAELNDYNPYDYNIPDNCTNVNSDLLLSGAPSDAEITKVKVYYEINHTRWSDLKIWLTAWYDGSWHDYILHEQGSISGSGWLRETRDNLSRWNGDSPNQTWYLTVKDCVSGQTGYIAFFELWVTYQANEPPNTPSNPDPYDGETSVSRTSDLDWNCSDPNGDVIYYTVYFEKNDSSPDNVVKNDATGSSVNLGTLDYGSHYYWQVRADDHRGGVTLGPVWDFYTEPAPVIDAEIVVLSIPDAIAGETISVPYQVTNTGNVSYSFGVGAEIRLDGDRLEDLGAQYTPSITPGNTYSGSYPFTIPAHWQIDTYVARAAVWTGTPGSSTQLDTYDRSFDIEGQSISADITNVSFNKSTVVAGSETISADITINNTGNQAWTFWIGASSIMDGGTDWYDWQPDREDIYLTPGMSGTVTLSWSPDGTVTPGAYGFYSKVFLQNTGTDYVDEYWQETAFTVEAPTIDLLGRISFHSYSDYLAEPINSTDGNVFVYSFSSQSKANITESLPIDNAMNAHFSGDGSRIVFMAIPEGAARNWTQLEIYLYDLSRQQLHRLTSNSIPDEDPKFAPDGRRIVFKRNGQIYSMLTNGTDVQQLTSSVGEKSGPNYSPDGTKIVYWHGTNENADIWWMNITGSANEFLVGLAGVHDYYPIFRDNTHVMFTRSQPDDDIQIYNTSTDVTEPAAFNEVGSEDSDPFPIDDDVIGLSSWRASGLGGWDIMIGNPSTGQIVSPANINSNLKDLGGWYSPFGYSRSVVVVEPSNGSEYEPGQSVVLSASAWSDGSIWANANPTIVIDGPVTMEYSGLSDNGTNGDAVAGDGVYSTTITLPTTIGDYTVTARATSSDNGIANQIESVEQPSISIAEATGSLRVNIEPADAASSGAQWRVDGGTWHNSGYTQTGLTVGQHNLEFNSIADWTTPNSQTVTINQDQLTTATGTYVQHTGALSVTISPQDAIDAGAQWRRVGTSTWYNSGFTESGIPIGQYTVEFKDVSGWDKPSNQSVTINEGQTTNASGTYAQQTGSLQVTISPQDAIDAGAQWRRVGTSTWRNSGYTESGIPVGQYPVEFKDVSGWDRPSNQSVTISDGETTNASGTYTQQTGSLLVTISPQGAIDFGAQWQRLGTSTWNNSGYTESNIPIGQYTVEFKTIACWDNPDPQTITVGDGDTAQLDGNYNLSVPSAADTLYCSHDTVKAGDNFVVSWDAVADADSYKLFEDSVLIYEGPRHDTTLSRSEEREYVYELTCCNTCGCNDTVAVRTLYVIIPTSVEEIDAATLPEEFVLMQNYPNPFNPETRIEFTLPRGSFVTIDVYNIVGKRVRNLANERLSAGRKVVTWDGRDDKGQLVSSGIYFYRIVTDDFTESKKMVLLK